MVCAGTETGNGLLCTITDARPTIREVQKLDDIQSKFLTQDTASNSASSVHYSFDSSENVNRLHAYHRWMPIISSEPRRSTQHLATSTTNIRNSYCIQKVIHDLSTMKTNCEKSILLWLPYTVHGSLIASKNQWLYKHHREILKGSPNESYKVVWLLCLKSGARYQSKGSPSGFSLRTDWSRPNRLFRV